MALLSALVFSVLLLQHFGTFGSEPVSCPALNGVPGSPGHNGLPGRDGRDGHPGPKGEKGELVSGLSVQGPTGKAGPEGPKGQKGEPGNFLSASLMQEVDQIKHQLNVLLRDIPTKVAFSAMLSTTPESGPRNIGPHSEDRTIVYENALTNVGNAYDTKTGIFTAPVKGVYYFIFVLFNANGQSTGLRLMKNKELVVAVTDNPPGADTEDTASNSVSLLLEKGDQVYLELVKNRKVYTDSLRRNTFSGHLLFAM